MNLYRSLSTAAVFCGLFVLSATFSFGQIQSNWQNAAGGNWATDSNWSSTSFPNNGQPNTGDAYDATIDLATGTAYQVDLNTAVTVNNLTLDSADATVNATGFLAIANQLEVRDGTFSLAGGEIAGGTIEQTGGTFNASGTFSGTQFNGTLNVTNDLRVESGANFNGQINLIRNSGTSGVDLAYLGPTSGAAITATLGGNTIVNLDAGVFGGTIDATRNTNLTLGPSTIVRGRGEIRSQGFFTGPEPTIVNQGRVVADQSGGFNRLQVAAQSGGVIVNQGEMGAINGGILTLNVSTGVFRQEAGGRLFVEDGGTITTTGRGLDVAAGAIEGNGTIEGGSINAVQLGGTLSAGIDGSGQLTVEGRLELTDAAVSLFQIGGTNAGATTDGYDNVIVLGELQIDGDLNVEFINGYENAISDMETFTLFNFDPSDVAELTGEFNNVANGGFLTTLDSNYQFQVHFGAGSQFDPNQVVLGNFRAVVVPEPGGLVLLGLASGVLAARRRRR